MIGLITMAIVVTSPPPPPATATQQQCAYSVRIQNDTYKCYTQKQWDAEQAAIAKENEAQAQAIQHWLQSQPSWWQHNWWKVLLGIFGLIVVFFIAAYIDEKLHPTEYDDYGIFNSRDWPY